MTACSGAAAVDVIADTGGTVPHVDVIAGVGVDTGLLEDSDIVGANKVCNLPRSSTPTCSSPAATNLYSSHPLSTHLSQVALWHFHML